MASYQVPLTSVILRNREGELHCYRDKVGHMVVACCWEGMKTDFARVVVRIGYPQKVEGVGVEQSTRHGMKVGEREGIALWVVVDTWAVGILDLGELVLVLDCIHSFHHDNHISAVLKSGLGDVGNHSSVMAAELGVSYVQVVMMYVNGNCFRLTD